jgi:hypothetical protein
MSRATDSGLRHLGRKPKPGAANADAFMTGRRAGTAWARRALNGDLALDIRHPEELTAITVRYWLRGFADGVTAESWHPGPTTGEEP